ncbi:nucleoside triphosphate pyrophosphohydrolase [Azospirillum sp. RWY-5-1]|uniref:Nucleoside triphosphate pyrophosphohydrolase n=1 Tax=Azospirillum oleiclasticum TaxID=2735135 RepID=A0ABX2T7T7_9PROT|nr:nucleoside triphosphate pyrophosphohydrolase [Azospirillum oleiclasticum]NYZ12058.1 nucleoside triphosphate pyrophosphohydrolase [Azospirillum oleiclasticum]NYZ19218.1 nucleoside triphosphate pyrophosphohydrolase [Azospirillum oleiclasticum]
MTRNIDRLLDIMARLRDPDGGCPWDLEQTYRTIAPHTIEEAYEVADAIEKGDMDSLREELGDLLFQVVYYAQFAREEGRFDFEEVAGVIADKMIRRHPHVFGDDEVKTAGQQTSRWEEHKAAERAAKAAEEQRVPSALDGVIAGLPALTRALKLQNRAARVGFDWTDARDILDKIEEEVGELRAEMDAGSGQDRIADELGDLLFALVNLARRLQVDPEGALRGTNAKFERRFHRIEALLAAQGRKPEGATLDEMEALWQQAKREE